MSLIFRIMPKMLLIRYLSHYRQAFMHRVVGQHLMYILMIAIWFGTNPVVPWDDPLYLEEMDDEDSPSVADEDSDSEFVPSESVSE